MFSSTYGEQAALAGKFSQFARLSGVAQAGEIDEALAERFVREELAAEGVYGDGPNAMRHVLDHLRPEGVIPRPGAVCRRRSTGRAWPGQR